MKPFEKGKYIVPLIGALVRCLATKRLLCRMALLVWGLLKTLAGPQSLRSRVDVKIEFVWVNQDQAVVDRRGCGTMCSGRRDAETQHERSLFYSDNSKYHARLTFSNEGA